MNLLVTGGCGFIGSHFINKYFNSDCVHLLVNIDALYYCANEKNVDISIRNSEKYKLVKGNINNADLVNYILNEYNITHVIHFAAQSHVQNSFENSLMFTQDNVVGTHVLLECCRTYGKIQKLIHVSTDEVYGESMLAKDEPKKTEQTILSPSNPYAATKAAAELIAQSYYHSYNMPIVITRGNNVYGPNQYPEKLIPKFIELLHEDKKVTIQGDGSNVRAFLHVDDTVNAFVCILEKGKIGEIYNIGCDEGMEYSVLDIAKMLIRLIKHTDAYDEWIEYVADRPFNDKRYYISNEKVKELGWEINVSFEEGIKNLNYYELYGKDIKYNIMQVNDKVDNNVYEVFVFCSGKCGSTTLHKTFVENGYKALHEHSDFCWQVINKMKGSIFDVIEKSRKHYGKIYIIDSYREPISRKISAFFQNLDIELNKYFKKNNSFEFYVNNLSTSQLIDIFCECNLKNGENYHSIDEICCYYNIPYIKEFDFKKGYILIEHENITIIKLLYKNIKNWNNYLSEIFNKEIVLFSDNISETKIYNNKYNDFLKTFKVDKDCLESILKNDVTFNIYNTDCEKQAILDKWSK